MTMMALRCLQIAHNITRKALCYARHLTVWACQHKMIPILIFLSLIWHTVANKQVDALYDMKLKLNVTGDQLSNWDQYQMDGPCTWTSVFCDNNSRVTQVILASMGFTGTLSPRIGELEYLNVLSLPGNRISGPIPDTFGNLSSLTSLELEDNLLTGQIPASLGKLSKLSILILSQNNLSGSIPSSLSNLSSLIDIQLAFNNLFGGIPPSLFEVSRYNFTGNNLECGANLTNPCYSNGSIPDGSHSSKVVVLGSIGAVIVLISIGLTLFLYKRKKESKIFYDVAGEDDRRIAFGQIVRFTWRELQLATDGFNERNVLGKGGFGKVYEGVLPDGTKIAVKRLTDYRSPGGEASFLREVELISIAVHRNLLRLIGFCTTQTESILVYPFMQNLSVAYRLREFKQSEPVLDWPTRKRIAVGTARALEYLHEHCNPKVIHRDIKAANVLLDEDFEPVVCDFGLAQLVDVMKSSCTTKVRGTRGYIAPEYILTGKSSVRTDVYGYGIMLLELVTGQRAIRSSRLDEEDDELLLDHVNKLLKREDWLDAILDKNLNGICNREEAEAVIRVSLLCTDETPKNRPPMSEVVRMLEGEGLSERWEEWQQAEVIRRRKNELLQLRQRLDYGGDDSAYNLEPVRLSCGR